MKEIIISMYAAALLFFSGSLRAQVTIGGEDPPQPFSVLELISKGTSGLRLPQMTTGERNTLTGSADFASEAGNDIDDQSDAWFTACTAGEDWVHPSPDACPVIPLWGAGATCLSVRKAVRDERAQRLSKFFPD